MLITGFKSDCTYKGYSFTFQTQPSRLPFCLIMIIFVAKNVLSGLILGSTAAVVVVSLAVSTANVEDRTLENWI